MYTLLKQRKLQSSNEKHLALVDPFVAHVTDCLTSQHVQVTVTSLMCLTRLLKLPLPALKEHVATACRRMFDVIAKYACRGAAASQDNFDLVLQCFKVTHNCLT